MQKDKKRLHPRSKFAGELKDIAMINKKFTTVEEYLSSLTPEARSIIGEVRAAIRKAAPKAEEVISYNMPAFKQESILVWYAIHKAHVGFYPRPSAIVAFKKELSKYEVSKGAIQFPLGEPMPLKLIAQIVKYRLAENLEAAAEKAKHKSK